ncbi:6245_t:CDS:1 [Dentiscutata heterogama]|uniref:6245_t:CDS:1 n=1 Tax=Dentiscutata heterogama TaxID=1316150 RepID=A0ACA9K0R2_9GLOM|nr:6245_t:CDS:1 [Dentiscutata heterogama]
MFQNKFLFFLYFVITFVSTANVVAQGSDHHNDNTAVSIQVPITPEIVKQLGDIISAKGAAPSVDSPSAKGMSPSVETSTPTDQSESEESPTDNYKDNSKSSGVSSNIPNGMNKQNVAASPTNVGPIKSHSPLLSTTSNALVSPLPTPQQNGKNPPLPTVSQSPIAKSPSPIPKAPLPTTSPTISTSKVSLAEHTSIENFFFVIFTTFLCFFIGNFIIFV